MKTFEIMFDDLNEDVQEKLLEFYGIKDKKELNYEIVPLATLEVEEEEELGNNGEPLRKFPPEK